MTSFIDKAVNLLPMNVYERAVLMHVISRGTCYDSHQFIADLVGCSRKKVGETLKSLTEKGIVIKAPLKKDKDFCYRIANVTATPTQSQPVDNSVDNLHSHVTLTPNDVTPTPNDVTPTPNDVTLTPTIVKDKYKNIKNNTNAHAREAVFEEVVNNNSQQIERSPIQPPHRNC
jgi:biotin operon repressor